MNEILTVALPTALVTAALTTLTSWGALKAVVNGTVQRVARIEDKVDTLTTEMAFLKGHLDRRESSD